MRALVVISRDGPGLSDPGSGEDGFQAARTAGNFYETIIYRNTMLRRNHRAIPVCL
jgi:hypothetical protein